MEIRSWRLENHLSNFQFPPSKFQHSNSRITEVYSYCNTNETTGQESFSYKSFSYRTQRRGEKFRKKESPSRFLNTWKGFFSQLPFATGRNL